MPALDIGLGHVAQGGFATQTLPGGLEGRDYAELALHAPPHCGHGAVSTEAACAFAAPVSKCKTVRNLSQTTHIIILEIRKYNRKLSQRH
jgi:hypothetical protein